MNAIKQAASATIAHEPELAFEHIKAAIAERTGRLDDQCTLFDLRNVLRDVHTRIMQIYTEALVVAVPELVDDVRAHYADILRKNLDAIDRSCDEIMTVDQAADLVGIGKQTIRRWIKAGHIADYDSVERRYQISRRRLRSYLQDRNHRAPAV
jgi:excisionase family DNA binding protein